MICGVGALTVKANCTVVVVWRASVTVMEKLNDPGAGGVPLRTPAGDRVSHAGNPVADHVYGVVPPVAVNVRE